MLSKIVPSKGKKMSENSKFVLFDISGLTILFTALGYFVYGSWQGALGVFIFSFVIGLLKYVGIIPILGPILYWFIAKEMVIPKIFELTGIYGTWLTGVIFWIGFGVSMILTIVILIILVMLILAAIFDS